MLSEYHLFWSIIEYTHDSNYKQCVAMLSWSENVCAKKATAFKIVAKQIWGIW